MYKYLTFKESTRVGSQNLSRSVFLKVSQERIPGSHPGMHSWAISRNTIFEKWKLSKASWMGRKQILTLCFCCRGWCDIIDISHRPPSKKILKSDCSSQNWWQIYFELIPIYNYLTFKASSRVGSQSLSRSVFLEVSQERVPGGNPGMHSWGISWNKIFEKWKTV